MFSLRISPGAPALFRAMCTKAPAVVQNDFEINPEFVNRNPRNLEQMLLARKPSGWEWDLPSREYWYRLDVDISKKNIRGKVLHNGGSAVVKAYSGEWGIRKQMISSSDTTAAYNVGRVLGRRCLEAGILAVHYERPPRMENSKKIHAFLKGLTEEGVPIKEPDALDEVEDRPTATMYR
ncbi:39S ribosomal protein L18, mitochondrial [Galendromus occidentalis]|uniref:Large ribosomal subunit protein uL18m n=1 Tax=Galendromus occidentalis TaxID=34638 RepID=A0AAJ6QRM1_9ACAR|nr:39S ribosomal protein L18, mitochondrial [Galendromus occidentalis]